MNFKGTKETDPSRIGMTRWRWQRKNSQLQLGSTSEEWIYSIITTGSAVIE